MLENENMTSANNVEVAETQTTENEVEKVQPSGAQEAETNTTAVQQSAEENARFAERRRRREQESAETKEQLKTANERISKYERLEKSLKDCGFEGSVEEIADSITARVKGIDVSEVRRQREDEQQRQSETEQLSYYKSELSKILINRDIDKIREKYPEVESLEDMPDGFIEIMATGKVKNPVVAYEMLLPKKEVPASTGSLKGADINTAKDFFTKDEVNQMSDTDIERNLDKIRSSMSRWK